MQFEHHVWIQAKVAHHTCMAHAGVGILRSHANPASAQPSAAVDLHGHCIITNPANAIQIPELRRCWGAAPGGAKAESPFLVPHACGRIWSRHAAPAPGTQAHGCAARLTTFFGD